MKDLDEALAEITAIRSQIARTAEFQGYGPVTVATTGLIALVAGEVQAHKLADPAHNIIIYIAIWMATAVLSLTLIGFEMVTRSRSMHSGLAEEMILTAVEQFMPAAVAGLLLTSVLVRFAPDAVWMLPGLWQVLFSLGIFASARFLPRATYAVGAWYLLCGLACLALSREQHVLSPWLMALPFGLGQLLAAAVLQWSQPVEDERF
ncbi:MAG TPA: hypothetical protein VMA09_14570 [Candidatus Binataceae bacterium]|nr:hypothetical protein [Candidatus Binataceae bacterium]